LQYCTGARPDECHRHRITRTTAGGYDLHGGHAGLRLNNGLDFPGADQETTDPHRVADPRLKDEAQICKVSEVAGPKHAICIDRSCRR